MCSTKAYIDNPFETTKPELKLPTTLNEIKLIQAENKYGKHLTEEQRSRLVALEEAIKNKKEYTKTKEQKKREKKLKKIANLSKRKNRH